MNIKTFILILCFCILFICVFSPVNIKAQVNNFTREDLIEYTKEWAGERFADGRPRVPDDILERMKKVPITLAYGVLGGEGYKSQYDNSEWECIHPDQVLVGRVLTMRYMPFRPQVNKINEERDKNAGGNGHLYSRGVEMLQDGDVYVADGFGKHVYGALIGDNYAAAIYAKTGNGAIINSSVRDLEGIAGISGFNAFVRSWHPTSVSEVMMMGVNVPILIGGVTVMPGDVVLAKREGIVFIPPHLAKKIVKAAEIGSLRDRFGIQMIIEKRYGLNQIHAKWSEEIEKEFTNWLKDNIDELPVPKEDLQEYIKSRE